MIPILAPQIVFVTSLDRQEMTSSRSVEIGVSTKL